MSSMAKVLSERMKSPGAMAELFDRTQNPLAQSQVGDAITGSDKQEPAPLDAQSADEGDGDEGLGMLQDAYHHAHGDKKAEYSKAIDHAHSKKEAHQKGFKHRGGPTHQHDRMGGKVGNQNKDNGEAGAKGMPGQGTHSQHKAYESRESKAGGMPGRGIFKRT